MAAAVLDASALLAMLRAEPGGAKVLAALDGSAISTVNLGEVVGYYARMDVPEPEIRELLRGRGGASRRRCRLKSS
jgi:PIN domain nuclease of toxin-antitoxin system